MFFNLRPAERRAFQALIVQADALGEDTATMLLSQGLSWTDHHYPATATGCVIANYNPNPGQDGGSPLARLQSGVLSAVSFRVLIDHLAPEANIEDFLVVFDHFAARFPATMPNGAKFCCGLVTGENPKFCPSNSLCSAMACAFDRSFLAMKFPVRRAIKRVHRMSGSAPTKMWVCAKMACSINGGLGTNQPQWRRFVVHGPPRAAPSHATWQSSTPSPRSWQVYMGALPRYSCPFAPPCLI